MSKAIKIQLNNFSGRNCMGGNFPGGIFPDTIKKYLQRIQSSKRTKVLFRQKQPSRGVLRKRCSENMQEIYRRTPMPTCDFNKIAIKSHCGMGVILKICCIFSECLFLGTPLSGCLCTLLPFQPTTVKCELFSLLDV